MKKFFKYLAVGIVALLFLGVATVIAMIIYYYPAIDRVYIRPCHYYPNMFINCDVVE